MPPLRLILLRHAKSDWGDAALADHDRPLNRRGRRACEAIGPWLAEQGYAPDLVLCSSAVRTRETWDRIAPVLPEAQVEWDEGLYLAEPEAMRSRLDAAHAQSVMMIGHNPGIGAFGAEMAEAAPAHPKFGRFPTAAVLILEFDAEAWPAVTARGGHVVDFIVPRDLTD